MMSTKALPRLSTCESSHRKHSLKGRVLSLRRGSSPKASRVRVREKGRRTEVQTER